MKKLPLLPLLLILSLLCTGCTHAPVLFLSAHATMPVPEVVELPILMYHHFTETMPETPTTNTCSAETFRSHLSALQEAGYETVTFADVLAFLDTGTPLPEKPILLTSDDGYTSVLTVALPILREFDMTMTVGVVGSMMGRETGLPHFSLAHWQEETAGDGCLELVSHTWNLHNWNDDEQGVLTADQTLSPRLLTDIAYMQALPALNQAVFVYPFGQYSPESEETLLSQGYRITVTTRDGIAQLTPHQTEATALPRIGVHDGIDGETLLKRLTKG